MGEVLSVLTFKGCDHIIGDGGTQSWVLSRPRALACDYVVCARHQQGPHKPEGSEPHKHAFLIGKVSDVVPSEDGPDRWRVEFQEYALLDGPKLPLKSASPTQYFASLKQLGIDVEMLEWHQRDESLPPTATADTKPAQELDTPAATTSPKALADVVAEARNMIATAFGVAADAIQIGINV